MRGLLTRLGLVVFAALLVGCQRASPVGRPTVRRGDQVALATRGGDFIGGEVLRVTPSAVTIRRSPRRSLIVPWVDVTALKVFSGGMDAPPGQAPVVGPMVRVVTVPAGTRLSLVLVAPVEPGHLRRGGVVEAVLKRSVNIGHVDAVPAGSLLVGTVVRAVSRARAPAIIECRFEGVLIGRHVYPVVTTPVFWRAWRDARRLPIGAPVGYPGIPGDHVDFIGSIVHPQLAEPLRIAEDEP